MADINYNALPEKLTPSVTGDKVLIIDSEDGDIVKQQDALQFKGPTGDTGSPGTNAPATQFEYSIDGSTLWHSTFTTGDKYLRTSVDGGSTWSAGIKFVGENGTGDMNKSIYDTDNDGVVDDSERLGGQLPSYYSVESSVVHKTGDETIGGTKTFSSDVIVPDEEYGTGWDGSLEVPTKNAIYDKLETIGGGGGFDNVTSTTYTNGVLTQIISSGITYDITYEFMNIKTITNGTNTWTVNYNSNYTLYTITKS